MSKTKLLMWGDYCVSTGFGTVMSNIARELHKTGRYDIDVVGINYSGDPYDTERWPGRVWPAMSAVNLQGNYGDPFGRQRFLDRLMAEQYDVAFILQDTFNVHPMMEMIEKVQTEIGTKIVYYFPLDAPPKPEWITEVVGKMASPVTYTNYALEEIRKVDPKVAERTKVIYHGTNTQDFYYIEDRDQVKEFRSKYFNGLTDNKFLVMNVNRNQARKDIVRNFMVLKELRERGIDDVVFYLHMQVSDVGGNLLVMAQNFGLEVERDFIIPHPKVFNANQGLPVEVINHLYNSADCVFTTTLGEGWGLSMTEAMATRTPVIAPNNTSLTEMLANERGYLVNCGTNQSMWVTKEMDNERVRPLMDVEDAADAIVSLKDDIPSPVDLDKAYDFVQRYTWENVVKEWVGIIDEAAKKPQPNRQQRRAQQQKR